MIISTRLVGGVVILDLAGKMTLGEGDECLKENVSAVINLGLRKLLINLTELSYMDSAGLGEIKRSWEGMNKVGGKIKLLGLSYQVMGLFKVTRMDSLFEIFTDEHNAVKSFNPSLTDDEVRKQVEHISAQYPGLFFRGGMVGEIFIDEVGEDMAANYVSSLRNRGYATARAEGPSIFVKVEEAVRVDFAFMALGLQTLLDDASIIGRIRPHPIK